MTQAGPGIRDQLRAKPKERAENPCLPKSALRGVPDCYKVKLRQSGHRLVYRVEDNVPVILVIAIGRRDKDAVYEAAKSGCSVCFFAGSRSEGWR